LRKTPQGTDRFNALGRAGANDQTGVMMPVKAPNDLWCVVTASVGPLLAR